MEDDAFHHAALAGGKEMFQALGSTGPLQGLVWQAWWGFKPPFYQRKLSLEEYLLCLQSFLSSLHDAKLQYQGRGCHGMAPLQHQAQHWHSVFAGPGSDRGPTPAPFVFPFSARPTPAAEPGTARQQIRQQHGTHHPQMQPEVLLWEPGKWVMWPELRCPAR